MTSGTSYLLRQRQVWGRDHLRLSKEERVDGGKSLVHASGLYPLPFLCPYGYCVGKLTPQLEVMNISLRPPVEYRLVVIPGGQKREDQRRVKIQCGTYPEKGADLLIGTEEP